jgi:hypothetical protein
LSNELQGLKHSIEKQIESHYNASVSVERSLSELQDQIDDFQMNITSSQNIMTERSTVSPVIPTNSILNDSQEIDRSHNIIVYGIREDRDMTAWRQNLDAVLRYVVGRDVDVVDSFRLGKYNGNKTRPILVKLRTLWDRRVLLYSCWKLRNYHERIYVWADEPLEVRRKKSFERMKYCAERDGKLVSVDNDVLIVDNVPIYSLLNGYIAPASPM